MFIIPFFFTLLFFSSGVKLFNECSKSFIITKSMNLFMKKDRACILNTITLPRGNNQRKYVEYLNDDSNNIVVAYGPAGTGKTMFACTKAINLLKIGKIKRVVITRPVVPVEEDIGFLPGNIVKKMDPWTRPIFDIFTEHYSKTEIDNMIYNNIIEISPLAYMRGRTFKNSFIIADEMQNSSPNQMMMLTTRIGENSKMVITGDLKQSDKSRVNGLSDLIQKLEIYYKNNNLEESKSMIKLVELCSNDIERSEVVKKIIDIYNYNQPKESERFYNSTKYSNGNGTTTSTYINNYFINNDAALIPKSHSFRKIWEQ